MVLFFITFSLVGVDVDILDMTWTREGNVSSAGTFSVHVLY
jgi:hypothetical protein